MHRFQIPAMLIAAVVWGATGARTSAEVDQAEAEKRSQLEKKLAEIDALQKEADALREQLGDRRCIALQLRRLEVNLSLLEASNGGRDDSVDTGLLEGFADFDALERLCKSGQAKLRNEHVLQVYPDSLASHHDGGQVAVAYSSGNEFGVSFHPYGVQIRAVGEVIGASRIKVRLHFDFTRIDESRTKTLNGVASHAFIAQDLEKVFEGAPGEKFTVWGPETTRSAEGNKPAAAERFRDVWIITPTIKDLEPWRRVAPPEFLLDDSKQAASTPSFLRHMMVTTNTDQSKGAVESKTLHALAVVGLEVSLTRMRELGYRVELQQDWLDALGLNRRTARPLERGLRPWQGAAFAFRDEKCFEASQAKVEKLEDELAIARVTYAQANASPNFSTVVCENAFPSSPTDLGRGPRLSDAGLTPLDPPSQLLADAVAPDEVMLNELKCTARLAEDRSAIANFDVEVALNRSEMLPTSDFVKRREWTVNPPAERLLKVRLQENQVAVIIGRSFRRPRSGTASVAAGTGKKDEEVVTVYLARCNVVVNALAAANAAFREKPPQPTPNQH